MNGNRPTLGLTNIEYSMPVASTPYNTWTHIVVTVSNGSSIKMYANGGVKGNCNYWIVDINN